MTAVLLYPGAGTDASHPSLVAIEKAVAPTPCVRADFPYRKLGRRSPDRPPVLMAAVRSELDTVVGEHGGPVVMGGRSMGGRMCSMVAAGADGDPPPAEVAGLVLICYPLHPPGKPDEPARRAPSGDHRALSVRVGHQGSVRHARGARALDGHDPRRRPPRLDRRRPSRPQRCRPYDRRRRHHLLQLRSVCVRPPARGFI